MSTSTTQAGNTTDLAQTVNNLPIHQDDESRVDPRLKKEAEEAIKKYIMTQRETGSPMFHLNVLLRKPSQTEEGKMEYDELQIEWLMIFLEKVRRMFIDPRCSRILVKQGWRPADIANDMDRLVDFFTNLNKKRSCAHLELYNLQLWDAEFCNYSNKELQDIKDKYDRWAQSEAFNADLWRTPKRK